MNIQLYIIIVLVVALVIHLILARIYKDVEKKDKGFVISYFRLTYRRRLIRSLWGIPIMILLYLVVYWMADFTAIQFIYLAIIFVLLLGMDIVYNYIKWKKHEMNS